MNLNREETIHRVFCVLGRTCAGKDTFVNWLCDTAYPDMFRKVTSYTTRPKRDNEQNGREHYFTDKAIFDHIRKTNEIIAYTKIGEYEYMATLGELVSNDDPRYPVYIIDPCGLKELKENFPDLKISAIYVYASFEERRSRFFASGRYSNTGDKDPADIYAERTRDEDDQFTNFESSQGYDILIDTSINLKGSVIVSENLSRTHQIPLPNNIIDFKETSS